MEEIHILLFISVCVPQYQDNKAERCAFPPLYVLSCIMDSLGMSRINLDGMSQSKMIGEHQFDTPLVD